MGMQTGRREMNADWSSSTTAGHAAPRGQGIPGLGMLHAAPSAAAAAGPAHRGRGVIITGMFLPAAAAVCKVHNIAVIPCSQARGHPGGQACRNTVPKKPGRNTVPKKQAGRACIGRQAGRQVHRRAGVAHSKAGGYCRSRMQSSRDRAREGRAAAHQTLPPLQPGASWLSLPWALQGRPGSRGLHRIRARCALHK